MFKLSSGRLGFVVNVQKEGRTQPIELTPPKFDNAKDDDRRRQSGKPAISPPIGRKSYTQDLKIAVSIPDRTYEAAEQYARRRRIPRSQVYAEALAQFLAGQESDEDLTAALDKVCRHVDTRLDEFGRVASRRGLARSEW